MPTFVAAPVQQQGGLLLLRRAQPAAAAPFGLWVQRLGGERKRGRQQQRQGDAQRSGPRDEDQQL